MNTLKKYALVLSRLLLLLALIFCSFSILANTSPESIDTTNKVNSNIAANDTELYWTILLNTLYVFIVLPFVYIAFLRIYQLPQHLKVYHFKGEYNAENIIKYIERFEGVFAKEFPKFKKTIDKCGKQAGDEFENYSEAINNNLFCIKLNGRKRLHVFSDCSDWFLKALLLSIPITGIFLVVLSYHYFNLTGLMLSIVPLLILIPLYLSLLSLIFSLFRYFFRITRRELPALSVAQFALESITNYNVKRAFDSKKREYFYYSIIHKYNNDVNADAFRRRHAVDPNPYNLNGVIDDYNVKE